MFSSKFNPLTGKMEWIITNKDYNSMDTDLSQEFSRSHYGDMVHDRERNQKYYEGLRWAVNYWLSKGVEPRVLDIGTGTSLLSLMAGKCGAKNVTACEVLPAMVKIANEVIKDNNYTNIIKVINKRSTELTVGPDGDMSERCNILVSEVFDSELIGEGAIETFSHAKRELLVDDALVIPSKAVVYINLIESEFLYHSQCIDPKQFPKGVNIEIPGPWKHCPGPASLWDLHLEELEDKITILSDPVQLGEFDFTDPYLPKKKVFPLVSAPPTRSGTLHALAVWWTLTMAPGVELSMSPWQPVRHWRDHWLPCVQILTDPLAVSKDNLMNIQLVNDEYTLWTVIQDNSNASLYSPPLCTCGVHLSYSRARLRMINDNHRNIIFDKALEQLLSSDSTVLCVSDGTLLPLLCTKYKSANEIFTVETNHHSHKTIKELLSSSSLTDTINIISVDPADITPTHLMNSSIDVLIAEPFFISSTMPWHNLFFWYIRTALDTVLSPNCLISPCTGYLKGIAVQFDNLHLLKAPLGVVEGFDIKAYDRTVSSLIPNVSKSLPPEDYSLWEYPCYPLSGVQTLMKFDFTSPVPKDTILKETGSWSLATPTSCHGIVLWMEYQLINSLLISEGLATPPVPGERLQWSSSHNQAVCFFVREGVGQVGVVYDVGMDTSTGQFEFDFELI